MTSSQYTLYGKDKVYSPTKAETAPDARPSDAEHKDSPTAAQKEKSVTRNNGNPNENGLAALHYFLTANVQNTRVVLDSATAIVEQREEEAEHAKKTSDTAADRKSPSAPKPAGRAETDQHAMPEPPKTPVTKAADRKASRTGRRSQGPGKPVDDNKPARRAPSGNAPESGATTEKPGIRVQPGRPASKAADAAPAAPTARSTQPGGAAQGNKPAATANSPSEPTDKKPTGGRRAVETTPRKSAKRRSGAVPPRKTAPAARKPKKKTTTPPPRTTPTILSPEQQREAATRREIAKLKPESLRLISERHADGERPKRIARDFGVSEETIKRIGQKKTGAQERESSQTGHPAATV